MSHNSARDQRRGGRGTVEGRKRWRMRPTLMALEDRRLLSTIVVNNPTDTPAPGKIDLRQAIVQANTTGGAETIVFDKTVFMTPRTITLNGTQLELRDTTGTETIKGPKAGVTVSGGGLSRALQVDKGVTASISGLTIARGNASSGSASGLDNFGTLTVSNSVISSITVTPVGVLVYEVKGVFSDGSRLIGTVTLATPQGPVTSAELTVTQQPTPPGILPLHGAVTFSYPYTPPNQTVTPFYDLVTLKATGGRTSYALRLDIGLKSIPFYPPPPFLGAADFYVDSRFPIPLHGPGTLTLKRTAVLEP